MKKKQFLAVMLLAQAPLASAATTGFDNEVDFLAQLNSQYYLEDFSTYTYGNPFDGGQLNANYGPVNDYSWTASAPIGLYSNSGALSTASSGDTLTITFTGNPVTALGGIFASTDLNGDYILQTVTVNLSDNTSELLTTGLGFLGFTSAFAITSLTIDGVDAPDNNWPQLDHFYVGSKIAEIAPVPVPAAVWLFGSGL
ncbi:MAG: hypothetical protein LUQ26_07525, partial [Methylococcaceae bacterium]|nr:hypothetical protein [Methylococcaceae bacterium]